MVEVPMKDVYRVTSKGKTYYYAWRGGPGVKGEPGSPEFVRSLLDAYENRTAPNKALFSSVRLSYKAGPFLETSQATRRTWGPWLDEIGLAFDAWPLRVFTRPEKVRPLIRDWRNQYLATPRAADTALQVLSVVCSHGVDPMGVIGVNPVIGMKRVYSVDRSEIIWEPGDIAAVKRFAPVEVAWAVDLAATTGLRQTDLMRLTWSAVKDDHIYVPSTSKTGAPAWIPLYDELLAVLASIPRRGPMVLTNSSAAPWGAGDGKDEGKHFRKAFGRAKNRHTQWAAAQRVAGSAEEYADLSNKHFHDLRGTAATKFYNAGLKTRVIAEIMAWEEETVEKIIRKYVGRHAATQAIIRQLNANISAKPIAKLSGPTS